MANEYFGNADQQRMARRGEALMRILQDDPRFCSHGRGVQLAEYSPQSAQIVEDLARLLGASACEYVPVEDAEEFEAGLRARGLKTDRILHYFSNEETLDLARAAVLKRPLPDDLSVQIVDKDSSQDLLEAFAEVSMPHGVLPPAGNVMRGISRPGFAMVAIDANNRPVATAGSVASNHPKGPAADKVQWGQLATVPNRQGEGIAKTLGAMAMLEAEKRLDAKTFRTGIREGNTASDRLCRSLGMSPSPYEIVIGIDPEIFGEARLTK